MRKLILGSLSGLLAAAGLAGAQSRPSLLRRPTLLPPRETTTLVAAETPPAASVVPSPLPATVPSGAMPAGQVDGALIPAQDCLAIEGACGGGYNVWFGAEYLLWWTKKNDFPPLLVVGPASSFASRQFQVIGRSELDDIQHSGGRFSAGGWFTEYQGFGIEASAFFLESKSFSFGANGTGAVNGTVVGRPFFDLLAGTQTLRLISFPNFTSGSAEGSTAGQCSGSSRIFGAEFNFLVNLCCDCSYRVDLLLGYRYLSLDDRFHIVEDSRGVFNGDAVTISDRFNTGNRFSGGQVGARAEWRRGRLGLNLLGKVAIGQTDETLDSGGLTTLFNRGGLAPQTVPSGFLAVAGNSGRNTCEHFTIVPEAGARVSFQVLDCLNLHLGYTFLYWSEVARSGNQVNQNVNILETPVLVGPLAGVAPRPVTIVSTDFWAHGLTAGFELRY